MPVPLLLSVCASWAARSVTSVLTVALLMGPAGASGGSDSPITFDRIGVVQRVVYIRAGRLPAVEYVEGCL